MKLQHSTQDLEINGDEETSTFSIAMNGKAFRVLSDTLYQNKIGSIVREISCNAYDAHVAAGKADVPFEIHLPDAFEPWFSVKDYGPGLTRNAIKTVFTQYFNSTKENDNDAIGAFGLGAKTPFSYTDQFTVTSVAHGEKVIWTAYIGKSGVPDISVMYAEESTEPTGVEIKMSAKREDFNTFKNEVQGQLQYFKVKPSIQNGAVYFPTYTCIEETSDYRMYTNGTGISIIQGNVGYPLILQNLSGKISDTNYNFVCQLARKKIDLLFTIGEIGVTASREGIEYNQTTVKNIEAKLEVVLDQLKKGTQAEIDTLSSDWDKAVLLQSKSELHRAMFSGIKSYFDTKALTFNSVTRMTTGFFERRDRHRKTLKSYSSNNIYALKTALVIYKDNSALLSRKLNYLLETQPTTQEIYVFSSDVKTADDLSKALGGCKVIKASEIILPKNARAPIGKTGPRKRYFEFEDNQWLPVYDKLSEIDSETAYVVTDRLAVNESVPYYYTKLAELQSVIPLIMIRETDMEFVKNNPLFIKVDKYVESQKKLYNPRMCRELAVHRTISQIRNNLEQSVISKMQVVSGLLPADHAAKVFFDQVLVYTKIMSAQKLDRAQKVADMLGLDYDELANQRTIKAVSKRYTKLQAQYPMLQWMKHWEFRERTPIEQLAHAFVAFSKL